MDKKKLYEAMKIADEIALLKNVQGIMRTDTQSNVHFEITRTRKTQLNTFVDKQKIPMKYNTEFMFIIDRAVKDLEQKLKEL
jgi:hypothetical protein